MGLARLSCEGAMDEPPHRPSRRQLTIAKPEQPVATTGRRLDLEIVSHGIGHVRFMPAFAPPFAMKPLGTVCLGNAVSPPTPYEHCRRMVRQHCHHFDRLWPTEHARGTWQVVSPAAAFMTG